MLRFVRGGERGDPVAQRLQVDQQNASKVVVAQQHAVVGRAGEDLDDDLHLVGVAHLLVVSPHALDPLRSETAILESR